MTLSAVVKLSPMSRHSLKNSSGASAWSRAVLAGEIPGELPDRNDVTGGNPLRITDFLLKCHDDFVRKLGAEEKIAKVTDKIRMRVNIGAFATVPFE